jgi:hypothetical protein
MWKVSGNYSGIDTCNLSSEERVGSAKEWICAGSWLLVHCRFIFRLLKCRKFLKNSRECIPPVDAWRHTVHYYSPRQTCCKLQESRMALWWMIGGLIGWKKEREKRFVVLFGRGPRPQRRCCLADDWQQRLANNNVNDLYFFLVLFGGDMTCNDTTRYTVYSTVVVADSFWPSSKGKKERKIHPNFPTHSGDNTHTHTANEKKKRER